MDLIARHSAILGEVHVSPVRDVHGDVGATDAQALVALLEDHV